MTSAEPLRLGFVAGESSGDILGGSLMKAIAERTDAVEFHGVGGTQMLDAGLKPIVDIDHFAVNGFVEPLKRLPQLYRDLRLLVKTFDKLNVDAVVGVDFNVFNQMLEIRVKRLGRKTIHYVSPSVWAWRKGRINKVRKATDVMLTLFPFEPEMYRARGIRAEFVGHPLADKYDPSLTKETLKRQARAQLDLPVEDCVLALLPGSRGSELRFHLDLFLEAAELFAQLSQVSLMCVVPVVHLDSLEWIRGRVNQRGNLKVRLIEGQSDRALAAADVALVKSGTSTLEALLLKTPMVVAYRIGSITYRIISSMLTTDYVALPNILSKSRLVPELLQDEATPEALAHALVEELQHTGDGTTLTNTFKEIHLELRKDAANSAADIVLGVAQQA